MSKRKNSILVFILLTCIIIGGIKILTKNRNPSYEFVLAQRGDVLQTVSATGQVVPPKKIELQFEVQGRLKRVKVDVGDKIKKGDILALLDSSETEIQLLKAQAARDKAKANLDKILSGAPDEDIRIYEIAVENAKIAFGNAKRSLENAKQKLADTKSLAENDLRGAYNDALNVLDDAYLKVYNCFNVVDFIQKTYFYFNDQESLKVKAQKSIIKEAKDRISNYLDKAKDKHNNENIDAALSVAKKDLQKISEGLTVIREMCEKPVYRGVVSITDKNSIDNQRAYINAARANIVNSQHLISSTKIANKSKIDIAKSNLDLAVSNLKTAEGNLRSAQSNLAKVKAPPRENDIKLARAQLKEAEFALSIIQQQINKRRLISPCDGIITAVNKEEGELVGPAGQQPVISLLCAGKQEIKVDIPEADISKIKLGDRVKISLDAFPEKIFWGKVNKIDPAETIIQGVVYYKVTVGFDSENFSIKPGMTADVDIIANSKKDTIFIPKRAVLIKNGKKIVRILDKEGIEEIEVKTGIEGSEGEIEIISGLKEGDKVVLFIKQR